MLFTNACIFLPEGRFQRGCFRVENGRFTQVGEEVSAEGIDLQGALVLPGLVDIHTHGCAGADFSDGDLPGLKRMGRFYAAHGVTAFCPTSMSLPYERLREAFLTAAAYADDPPEGGARMAGIHLEGPFLSPAKRGAQNEAYLRLPDGEAFRALNGACGGRVALVDVAPELAGAEAFIRQAAKACTVSLAHTEADYDRAAAAFSAGASHVTHLFNAMPPLHHRAPGLIGAASERENVTAELIADGLHVHPSMVRAAFRLFSGRIALISDSIRCCGLPEGAYELGGLPVTLKGRAVRLADGTLAGSATDLFTCLKNAVAWGIPREEALLAATLIPAKCIGKERQIGAIRPGAFGDFLLCDEELNLKRVYLGGRPLA